MRTDSGKFKIFMEILKKYNLCKAVVQKIEGSLSTTKVPHPKMEDRKVGASLGARKRSRSDTGVTESQQCDASQSSMVVIGPTLRQQPVHISTGDRENSRQMEQGQQDNLKERSEQALELEAGDEEAEVVKEGENQKMEEDKHETYSLQQLNETKKIKKIVLFGVIPLIILIFIVVSVYLILMLIFK